MLLASHSKSIVDYLHQKSKSHLLLPILVKSSNMLSSYWHPEMPAIQPTLEELYKRVQTAEAHITSKTQQLEDELHKQRGGKHDRRVLTKARLATAECLTTCRQVRGAEKENQAVQKARSLHSNDPERRQPLGPTESFENYIHTFQLSCSSSGPSF